MNRLPLIPLAVSLMTATSATPAAAAEVQIAASGPVVELTISEQVKAAPDLANLSAGVTSEAPTAVEALQMNSREMTAVVRKIKALGIADEDIQTTGISLNPRYDYDRPNQSQVFRGYQVSNRVSVTVRNIAAIGPILDALVAAGATDLNGPNFSIDDDSAAKAQARQTAMETAALRAREYAGWAGYSNVRLLEVSEGVSAGPPRPFGESGLRAMDASAPPPPVQPGLVGTGVTLTVKYEMVR